MFSAGELHCGGYSSGVGYEGRTLLAVMVSLAALFCSVFAEEHSGLPVHVVQDAVQELRHAAQRGSQWQDGPVLLHLLHYLAQSEAVRLGW